MDPSSRPPKIQWKVKSIGEVDEGSLLTHIQLLRRLCHFCVYYLKVLSSCPSVDFYCILQYAARVIFSKMQLWPCNMITIQVIWLPFLHKVKLWDKPTYTSTSGLFLSLGPFFSLELLSEPAYSISSVFNKLPVFSDSPVSLHTLFPLSTIPFPPFHPENLFIFRSKFCVTFFA